MSVSQEPAVWDLVILLWRGRRTLIVMMSFGAIAGAALSFSATHKYEAAVLVSPVSTSGGAGVGGGSRGLSSLGGLAALAGVNIQADASKAEAMAVLESAELTERYIQDQGLLKVLFQDRWNVREGQWDVRGGKKPPSLWSGNQFFAKKVRRVSTNAKTGLVTLSIVWTDPQTAADWANGLVALANSYLRDRAIKDSQRNIEFLNDQVAKTNVVELRQAIFSLLTNEINTQMLARGTSEYAFKVLDVAKAPEDRKSPNRKVWAIMGFALGSVIGMFTLFAYAALKRNSHTGNFTATST